MLDLSLNRDARLRPSEVASRLDGLSESVLLAVWAMASTQTARLYIARYCRRWRHVQPTLTGDDLKAMGLKPGPLFGKLLDQLRRAWLDGNITTPDQEQAFVQKWITEGLPHDSST